MIAPDSMVATTDAARCSCRSCKGTGYNDEGGGCLCRWEHDHDDGRRGRVGTPWDTEERRRRLAAEAAEEIPW